MFQPRYFVRSFAVGMASCVMMHYSVVAQTGGPVQIDHLTPGAGGGGANVNTFTGEFSFSLPLLTIPGPQGSDYTISLGYNSSTSPEAGASWVGYGWSLNPGAVVRGTKGFPDDTKGEITVWNKRKRNWTVTAALRGGIEAASSDFPGTGGSYTASHIIRYNNHKGFSVLTDFSAASSGIATLNYNYDDIGNESFSVKVDPQAILGSVYFVLNKMGVSIPKDGIAGGLISAALSAASRTGARAINQNLTFGTDPGYSTRFPAFKGEISNYEGGMTIALNPVVVAGPDIGAGGTYSWQEAIPQQSLKARGSFYLDGAGASDLLDYHSEKDGEFKLDNAFLPIPFAASDNFLMTGNSGGGAFRLVNRRTGVFRPNYVHSETPMTKVEAETILGMRIGFSATGGLGGGSAKVGGWNDENSVNAEYNFESLSDANRGFFRVIGDRGGNLLKAHTDDAVRSTYEDDIAKIPSDIFAQANEGEYVGRNTHIGFNLNQDLLKKTSAGQIPYLAYNKDQSLLSHPWVQRDEAAIKDQIGEICITGDGGSRYIYGLPVYARNEQQFQLGLGNLPQTAPTSIKNKSIIYAPLTPGTAEEAVGEERPLPYASAYLLSLITSADYVDLTLNGPTPDDLGGYVKFNYLRAAGSVQKAPGQSDEFWYHWRAPYNGLFYDRNDLSDKTDDIGAYTSGEREMYYVESIETKTHIAIFVNNKTDKTYGNHTIKGSGRERLDAYQAPHLYAKEQELQYTLTAAGDSTATDAQWLPKSGGGYELRPNKSRYLERIELYTKDENGDPDSLLSTVHLEYDYSLRRNMPNSALPHPDSTVRAGMLTMRRIWMQNQRIYNARITPYIFNYGYKKSEDFPQKIRNLYPTIVAHADTLSPGAENPSYNRLGLDAWGINQPDGASRRDEGRLWLSQDPDKEDYDPAAWLLKGITTPSQGELLVQYEAGDYGYVQDRPAHVMTSLRSSFSSSQSMDGDNDNRYWINLSDLGIADTSRGDVMRYFSLLKQHYAHKDERAYFKFLYALVGTQPDFDAPGNTSGYINGHAKVDADNIILDSVSVGGHMTYGIALRLRSEGVDSRMPDVPKKVCLEYVKTSKRGKLRDGDAIRYTDNGIEMIAALVGKVGEVDFHAEQHCQTIEYDHSYIRLPAYHPKKGGQARVKRLLTLADDSRNGSVLYGSEYQYSVYDEERREYISSGVAVDEPATIREENALVRPIFPAGKDDVRKKIIAGPDRMQYEGPLGESLLPGASIGYGRVVMKSIHSGKTAPGFSIAEYHTAKDYPLSRHIDGLGNSIEYTDVQPEKEKESPLWGILQQQQSGWLSTGYHHSEEYVSVTQGYRFILNSMHGQSRRSATYGGIYENKDSWALSSLQEYTYFEPGTQVPVVRKIGEPYYFDYLGKEMDVNIESRTIEDNAVNGGLHGDISFSPVWPLLPIGTAAAWVRNESRVLNTQTISKVIRYPSILKGVLSYGDGIYHYTEHRAFDAVSGTPVISRTVDGFDKLKLQGSMGGHEGSYHSYTFMGPNEYPGLGQKAYNERINLPGDLDVDITLTTPSAGKGQLAISSASLHDKQKALRLFRKGDLIRTHPMGPSAGDANTFFQVEGVSGDNVSLISVSPSLYHPLPSITGYSYVTVQFIESGLANRPGTSVGSIVTYGEKKEAAESAENFSTEMSILVPPRKWFADSLNNRLLSGGGFITPSQIQPLALQFTQPSGSGTTCAALLDTLHVSISNNILTLSLDRNPALCTDNFVMQGGPGRFDIDDHSRLIYIPADRDLPSQQVNCLRFCPDETILRKTSLTNVIAASAIILDDSLLYDPAEYPQIPADANQFEAGIAGRWNSPVGYTYRTAIAGGSDHEGSERNYNSGTFQDFTLFNWKEPQLNDTQLWLRSDTVIRHSAHGNALESMNPIGLYSVVKLGYGDKLPILSAANARYESVNFQDFENEEGVRVVEGESHSGKKHLAMVESGTTDPNLRFTVTDQVKQQGLLIKFWMKTTKDELPANGAGFLDINVEYEGSSSTTAVGLSPAHKVAQSGEWGLYEIHVGSIPVSVGTPGWVTITKYINPDIAFFDDMKVQPYDAAVQCVVYDTKTFRVVAAFDDDHFGVYPQYNAEGKVVRSIVETSRGIKTVAESHSNRPSIARTSGVTQHTSKEEEGNGVSSSARRTRSIDAPPAGLPLDGRFDLLDIELSPDKQKVDVLGGKDKLPNLDDLGLPTGIDSLSMPRQVKELEKLKLLEEIKLLDRRVDELTQEGTEEGSEAVRQAKEQELTNLRQRRAAILRQLGIPEEELRREFEEADR